MIWLSMALTVAVLAYTALQLLYQFGPMWLIILMVLFVSLVVLHQSARRQSFELSAAIGIVAVPLVSVGGLALRTGFNGIGYLLVNMIVGFLLFAGLYLCLSLENKHRT
jgi:hypothetical protein